MLKKSMALLLAAALCLSLVACGNSDKDLADSEAANSESTIEMTAPATEVETEPERPSVKANLNEAFTLDDFEFTINECKYIPLTMVEPVSARNSEPLHSTTYSYCVPVDFSIKYKGKAQKWGHTQEWYSLEYDDGYVLKGCGQYHGNHVTTSDGWDSVSVSTDFQPLSAPWSCRWFFPIPNEVASNTNAPLSFVINIDGLVASLDLRENKPTK